MIKEPDSAVILKRMEALELEELQEMQSNHNFLKDWLLEQNEVETYKH